MMLYIVYIVNFIFSLKFLIKGDVKYCTMHSAMHRLCLSCCKLHRIRIKQTTRKAYYFPPNSLLFLVDSLYGRCVLHFIDSPMNFNLCTSQEYKSPGN